VQKTKKVANKFQYVDKIAYFCNLNCGHLSVTDKKNNKKQK